MKARRLGMRRSQRLHGSRVFNAIRTTGDRRVCGCLIMNWRRLETAVPAKMGVVTSRRLGGAVVRSRARRMLREAFRLQQHHIRPAVELVLVARASLLTKSVADVGRDLRRCLRESGLWVEAEPVTETSPAEPASTTSSPCAPCS